MKKFKESRTKQFIAHKESYLSIIAISNKKRVENGKQKEWQQNNPEKIKQYANKHETHKISKSEWIDCKKYFNNECAYCGLPLEEHYIKFNSELRLGDFHKEHVDHQGSNNLSNCIPSCKSCNSAKHTHSLEDWYNEDNIKFTKERLDKIYKWVNEDYIFDMNNKKIKVKSNNN